ncbi:MAG: hypothetical protein IJH50_05335 [Kiritimatiellae bacterium]|nr:hypothetical protein [Kiritimatiellia bacterium]
MDLNMLHSLGFYIQVKRSTGATKADFESAPDYHDFLKDIEQTAVGGAMFGGFTAEKPLIPLDDITLTQVQYGDAITQMFDGGLACMQLSLPYPPLPVVTAPQPDISYFQNYLETIDGDPRTKSDVESVMERINSLLAEKNASEQRVNGLVVGRVQSGKTRNYVGLMLKAVDEGWNVIIVLTSSNTALADQTEGRIKEDFAKSAVHSQIPLVFRSQNAAISPTHLLSPGNISFYWGVAMKESHNLENLLVWLRQNADIAPKMRIMIIDDEADNATPDSNTRKNIQLSESEIDELVEAIREEDGDGRNYSWLADWIVSIQDDLTAKQTGAENDPGSKDDERIKALSTILRQGGMTVAEKCNAILGNDEFCELLNLGTYHEGDELVDLKQDILHYFNGKGKGFRSAGTFLKFLNTLLAIAVERSAINKKICELIDRVQGNDGYTFQFGRCAYVAYTATPYANILNERPGETPLYADFIKSLTTSPQYFGLDKIFGRDYKKPKPNMGIVEDILDDEKRYILNPLQELKDPQTGKILEVEIGADLRCSCAKEGKELPWTSMTTAIAWAFCTAGARRHRRLTKVVPGIENDSSLSADEKSRKLKRLDHRWTTMMVNLSMKTTTHGDLHEKITAYLTYRCAALESKQLFIDECSQTWDTLTKAYAKADFDKSFNDGTDETYGEIEDYPQWSEIADDVRYFIDGWNDNRVHAIVINSDLNHGVNHAAQNRYNQAEGYANTLPDDHLWIVIGGNTIGRGLTLTGLTVSYFDRVRKTVAVDTMTQMGRWFGYRKFYELLPRVWMTSDTVKEMKRTAYIEGSMHENMREKFNQGCSPSDPAHYMKIYCWTRKLTGRARAQASLSGSMGLMSTTDKISIKQNDVSAIYDLAHGFVNGLGPQVVRDEAEYGKYGKFPLWANVDKYAVKQYLESLLPYCPEDTKRVLKAVMREIDVTESDDPQNLKWCVVIGEPAAHRGESYLIVDGCPKIFSGNPETAKTDSGVARYGSVRSDMAFYAMIPQWCINYTDAEMVEDGMADVIKKAKDVNGNPLPVVSNVLAGYDGATLEDKLRAMVKDVKDHPEKPVPSAVRGCLKEGERNRSTIEYREAVYSAAGHKNPILQLYLLTPPNGADPTDKPLIAHAFYWPGHSPDDFSLVSIGMKPEPKNPTLKQFFKQVEDVLAQNGFPMSVQRLKAKVLEAFPGCKESFFDAHIAQIDGGAKYAKVPGKDAYYHMDWTLDPVVQIRQFVLERAAEILLDHQPHERNALAGQIFAENPRLEGLFNPESSADKSATFVDALLPQFGIMKVCGKPITYQIP